MTGTVKKGVFVILLGLLIPLVGFCFTDGFNPEQNLFANIYNLFIPVKFASNGPIYRLAFRFVLALGVLLVFIGIVKIDSARRATVPRPDKGD